MLDKHIDLEGQMDAFAAACRSANLRVTHQRLEIFRELAASFDHPTADALHRRVRKRMPTLSLDTLYRTLASLEEAGLISRLNTAEGMGRFEANHIPHDHFVCKKCGAIQDVPALDRDRITVGFSAPKGCRVDSLHVEIRGLCPSCGPKHQSRSKGKPKL